MKEYKVEIVRILTLLNQKSEVCLPADIFETFVKSCVEEH